MASVFILSMMEIDELATETDLITDAAIAAHSTGTNISRPVYSLLE